MEPIRDGALPPVSRPKPRKIPNNLTAMILSWLPKEELVPEGNRPILDGLKNVALRMRLRTLKDFLLAATKDKVSQSVDISACQAKISQFARQCPDLAPLYALAEKHAAKAEVLPLLEQVRVEREVQAGRSSVVERFQSLVSTSYPDVIVKSIGGVSGISLIDHAVLYGKIYLHFIDKGNHKCALKTLEMGIRHCENSLDNSDLFELVFKHAIGHGDLKLAKKAQNRISDPQQRTESELSLAAFNGDFDRAVELSKLLKGPRKFSRFASNLVKLGKYEHGVALSVRIPEGDQLRLELFEALLNTPRKEMAAFVLAPTLPKGDQADRLLRRLAEDFYEMGDSRKARTLLELVTNGAVVDDFKLVHPMF